MLVAREYWKFQWFWKLQWLLGKLSLLNFFGTNSFSMALWYSYHWVQWVSMVREHWSNDRMVSMDLHALIYDHFALKLCEFSVHPSLPINLGMMVKCRCYKLYAPNVYKIRLLQFPENILRSGGSEKLVHVIKVAAGGGGERKAKYLWEEPSATLKFAAFSAEKRCFHTPQPTGEVAKTWNLWKLSKIF